MLRNSKIASGVFAVMMAMGSLADAEAQSTARGAAPSGSKTQQTLSRAAEQGKYTFLLFYKSADATTRTMATALKDGLANKTERATIAYVRADDQAERALIAKYGLSRAPMPLTLVVAPNGAMTAVIPRKLTTADINDSFVTPTMMITMKSLQSGRIVLVNARGSVRSAQPRVLRAFQADPHFKDRLATVSMSVADPREAKFVKQMQLDPTAESGHVVLIAPPGVLVGKFGVSATKAEIAAALAKAGKCCNDPKCKHNK